MNFKIGDIVARKSYNHDIFFRIEDIRPDEAGELSAVIRGLDVRLLADSPLRDLEKVENNSIKNYRKDFINISNQCLIKIMSRRPELKRINSVSEDHTTESFFEVPGRVLHIDSSLEYLNLCTAIYEQLSIEANGFHITEKEQPAFVPGLIEQYRPDILVITGHDGVIKTREGYSDLNNYHNSKHFVEGVKAARSVENDKDDLIIFAGACQSHYEAILSAGANFASSPSRVLIHALDPVLIVEKIAFTPISQTVSIINVVESTITGTDGLGGIETRGKYRKGFPKSPYQ
ncbi:MAG TPA: sporulation peptidase YabG [Desulfobacteria bacterium]|nr:sporulation peptidase YabG [Desulfobacteria bacterium]